MKAINGIWLQFAVSTVAVAGLVALAGWAHIAKPTPPLDVDSARRQLLVEFPDVPFDQIWLAAKGEGAIVRSGESALVLFRAGDSYVARSMPWSQALATPVKRGRLRLAFNDVAAPYTRLSIDADHPWPPPSETV